MGVPKKNVLDDVFWLAVSSPSSLFAALPASCVMPSDPTRRPHIISPELAQLYNLAVHSHRGDTDRFYDILLPLLTDKPLETSLVETEGSEGEAGDWRSPQRAETAYVRCVLEAMHYMLRSKGVSKMNAKQVALAMRAQFLCMINNDIELMYPDANGQRVCSLACGQLAYCAVKQARALEGAGERGELKDGSEHAARILDYVRCLTDEVQDKLCASADLSTKLPPNLNLVLAHIRVFRCSTWPLHLLYHPHLHPQDGKRTDDANEHGDEVDPALMQFRDHLCWDTEPNALDPGQAIFLSKSVHLTAVAKT